MIVYRTSGVTERVYMGRTPSPSALTGCHLPHRGRQGVRWIAYPIVGACIARPRGGVLRIRRGQGKFVIFYRRTSDARPYGCTKAFPFGEGGFKIGTILKTDEGGTYSPKCWQCGGFCCTSSDLASLGHLPQRGRLFIVLISILNIVIRCLQW